MVWQRLTKVAERDYKDDNEKEAFRRGYADGYCDSPKDVSMKANYPNAYMAGYWEGKGDAERN